MLCAAQLPHTLVPICYHRKHWSLFHRTPQRVADLVIKDGGAVIIRQELVSPGHRIGIRYCPGCRSQRSGRVGVFHFRQDVSIAVIIIADSDTSVLVVFSRQSAKAVVFIRMRLVVFGDRYDLAVGVVLIRDTGAHGCRTPAVRRQLIGEACHPAGLTLRGRLVSIVLFFYSICS